MRPVNTTVFVCGVKYPKCTGLGCMEAGKATCSFELRGNKKGRRCGAALCAEHVEGTPEAPLCPPHARLLAR